MRGLGGEMMDTTTPRGFMEYFVNSIELRVSGEIKQRDEIIKDYEYILKSKGVDKCVACKMYANLTFDCYGCRISKWCWRSSCKKDVEQSTCDICKSRRTCPECAKKKNCKSCHMIGVICCSFCSNKCKGCENKFCKSHMESFLTFPATESVMGCSECIEKWELEIQQRKKKIKTDATQ